MIDSPSRAPARALYEREGYVEAGRENLGPLRWAFGFRSSTKMLHTL